MVTESFIILNARVPGLLTQTNRRLSFREILKKSKTEIDLNERFFQMFELCSF